MTAILALSDGSVFKGAAFGATAEAVGEVVFNTSMTGYQEILTDPSYRGQMVCMTYPLIGNYGINPEDVESRQPWLSGFIVKEACPFPSSWRSRVPLDDYLREHRIVGIQGIDTRALTRHLRDHGAQEGIISTDDVDGGRLAERARALPGLVGRDLVTEVSVKAPHGWTEGPWDLTRGYAAAAPTRFRVIAFDSGIKQNILRCLAGLGCNVEVMLGGTLSALGFGEEREVSHIAVKEAVFPFIKFPGVDTILGPEMKSTGEVMVMSGTSAIRGSELNATM